MFGNKDEADNLLKIEAWWLKRHGYFEYHKWGSIEWKWGDDRKSSIGLESDVQDPFNSYVRLHYTQTDNDGEKQDFDYRVELVTTPCHYGGKRYWFICPLSSRGKRCGRRVGVLYKSGSYFGCRHCHSLCYRSQNQNRNSKHYPFFRFMDLLMKEDDEDYRYLYYKGKPTKRLKRMEKRQDEMMSQGKLIKELDKLK